MVLSQFTKHVRRSKYTMIIGLFRLLIQIRTLLTYRIDTIAPVKLRRLATLARVLLLCPPIRSYRLAQQPLSQRLPALCYQLGPIYVKFAQTLATRCDIIDQDICDALATLQDNAPQFDGKTAIENMQQSWLAHHCKQLDNISIEPLAAASLAQVHAAELPNGQAVVIKILRPGIHQQVKKDLDQLHTLAKLIALFHPHAHRIQAPAVVLQYQQILLRELDLRKEAANTEAIGKNFINDSRLKVPTVYWEYCTDTVMVQERIYATPINQLLHHPTPGIDLSTLAKNGVAIFFTQLFRDNFFHADMHPGNIFVDISQPDKPQYQAVDFGIVGTLSEQDLFYIGHNLAAFFAGEYETVVDLHIKAGWVPAHINRQDMTASIRAVASPIQDKPVAEISFAKLFSGLLSVGYEYQMIVQPQLILLQKTLFCIEALGRQLYPQLNLWTTAQPLIKDWLHQQHNPVKHAKTIIQQLPYLVEAMARQSQTWHIPASTPTSAPTATSTRYNRPIIMLIIGILIGWWFALQL